MNEIKLNSLKGRLFMLRKAKRMSQGDIANEIGINIRTYQNYENEKNSIPHDIIIKLAKIYNVSLNFLLLGENDLFNKENKLVDIKNNTDVHVRLDNGVLITTGRTPLAEYIG